jgi:SOS-response transcriptional repressor LexA
MDETIAFAARGLGPNCFGVKLDDDSMSPRYLRGDIVIIDPDLEPVPGKCVLVAFDAQKRAIVRRYRPLSAKRSTLADLIAEQDDFPVERIGPGLKGTIVGRCVGVFRQD